MTDSPTNSARRSRHWLRTAAVVAALAVTAAAGACGDDDDDEAQSPATTAPAVSVKATDYGFEGIPSTMKTGTKLTLTNSSTKEVHELVAFRLPDGEKRSAKELVALPQAQLQALFAGPPAAVLVAPPSQPGFTASGDGTLSQPGRYLFLCFIPTGVNPDEYLKAAQAAQGGPPDVKGGPPHVVHGMYAEATVS